MYRYIMHTFWNDRGTETAIYVSFYAEFVITCVDN
jgi:hypothetical protein